MKKSALLASLLALSLLQSCGGGGSSNSAGSPPAVSVDEGGVSAPFALTDASQLLLANGPNGLDWTALANVEQTASGAIARIQRTDGGAYFGPDIPRIPQDFSLSDGNSTAKDIAGDASYALGRWVTNTGESSYHYGVYNLATTTLPAWGAYACTLQGNTTPTRSDGVTGAIVNAAATLNLYSGEDVLTTGAFLNGSLTLAFGADTVNVRLPTFLYTQLGATSGLVTSDSASAQVSLARADNAGYALMVGISGLTATAARYYTIVRLNCSETSATAPSALADAGSVSATFALTGRSVYSRVGETGYYRYSALALEQSASGAIIGGNFVGGRNAFGTEYPDYQWRLNGDWATKDIAGDTSYAMGRQMHGAFDARGQFTADGTVTYHYVAYNVPASFPASGTYACTLQSHTAPSDTGAFVDGGPVTLSFDSAGAHISGALALAVGGETRALTLAPLIASPDAPILTAVDGYETVVQVADAGNGGYAIMVSVSYDAATSGVARLSCSGG